MANLKYIGKNILNHDLILKKGNVSGSASSTGSFGNLNISSDASITGNMVVGGTLTAQEIHTEIESASIIFTSGSTLFGNTQDDTHTFTGSLLISGSISAPNLIADSASFSTRVTDLKSDSGSFSTRVTTNSSSLATRITNFSTGNVELISGSATSTGSFAVLKAIGGGQYGGEIPLRVQNTSATLTGVFQGSTLTEFEIRSGTNTSRSIIYLGRPNRQYAGQIWYDHNMEVMRFAADGDTERLRLSSTGATVYNGALIVNDSGDATNPAVQIGGTNDGIFHDSDGIKFQVNNATRFTMDDSGNFLPTGNVSGSSTSTGSFGRVEVEHIHSTDDISAADDITAGGRLVAETDAKIANIITLDANGISVGNDTRYIRIGSDSDLELNHRHPLHTSPFRASTNTNIITDKTNSGLLLFGGNPGIIMESPVSSSEGMFLSGSRANLELRGGNISGSSTSTGSFGRVEAASRVEAEHIHSTDDISADGRITSTDAVIGNIITISGNGISVGNDTLYIRVGSDSDLELNHRHPQHTSPFRASTNTNIITDKTNHGLLLYGGTPGIILESAVSASEGVFLSGSRANLELRGGNISGSAQSTASFGHFIGDGSGLENVFEGTVPSASISTRITKNEISASVNAASSASFSTRITDLKTDSGSFSTRVTDLKTDSGSFSTRVTDLKTDSGSFSTRITANSSSFAARDTLSEATSSKILNGELEFTNITGSGHVSMSLSSTGSFGRVSATTIGGHSPLSVDSITTFTNVITASSAVQLDGKVFIQTGSIEGDLHVRTNENLMRIGKSTSGLIVSGSEEVSRFATGSDGSIIDLGFTVTDEDGNVVLAGDGDGIHVDSNNYWYNNKYYKIGNGVNKFLSFDNVDLKYKGQVFASTGSFDGEMFINSPTGSMFIGKFTGGIPSSGSDNVSRFATGSDGSIIDLGFTTTNEDGETVLLTTGDGIVRDDRNYWYTTGHFKIGDADNFINWDTSNLTISGTFSGDGSGLTGLSSFDGSAGTETLFSGSATSTGSFGIIENNTQIAGFRPIINQTADFSASLSNAGRYHIVHGNLTCSIGTDASMPVTIGAEYEFFQSSSVGKFLFQTGSGVSLLSKNDNKNIAGQHSGATLKKVASNTFHLVGDLT